MGTLVNPYLFTGREYDRESGLYYYRARYYDPRVGRFLSEDPIGFDGGDVNLYTYVKNNPVNFNDPYGLWYIDINFGLGLLVGFSGITGGIIISPQGIYKYTGFGLSWPGPSGAVTFSPDNPAVGWNAGGQASFIGAYQQGRDYATLTDFREYGVGTPGFSFMMFYVDKPWTWPWRRGRGCK